MSTLQMYLVSKKNKANIFPPSSPKKLLGEVYAEILIPAKSLVCGYG